MSTIHRIFIIGHPGAGKALLGQEVAKLLGWRFIDADLGLESRIGSHLVDILGQQGHQFFCNCQHKILDALCKQTQIVVATDAGVVDDKKLRQLLLNEFTVFLDVSTPIQLERLSLNTTSLLPLTDVHHFLDELHEKRDNFYHEVAKLTIQGDEGTLNDHAKTVIDTLSHEHPPLTSDSSQSGRRFLNKEKQRIITLTELQAATLQLLAEGKSAKEIARETDVSYRTVEGAIAKIMELLGCSSSKELIALYHNQP